MSINDTLRMCQGGSGDQRVDIPDIPMRNEAGEHNMRAIVDCAANTASSMNIADVYHADYFDFSGMRAFDQAYEYRSQSLLTVPISDHEGEVIGLLQLINARDPVSGYTRAFSNTDQRFIEVLLSQAAIVLTNQQLIARLEELFESLVKAINIGLGEKSPHTGRHCEHVPVLTMKLADAVHEIHNGPLADFCMDERDRKKLWLAGLLHDSGKIATSVRVAEKATKRESLFDCIYLVDTRLEVLKRDVEIRALKDTLAQGKDEKHAEVDRRLEMELAHIEDDRVFLGRVNIGGESMALQDMQRVADIAAQRWVGADGNECSLLDPREKMNLTILSGTLNAQERVIINPRIAVTIRMLESLPWPKHLRAGLEYASGHHERMVVQGYPRGLRGARCRYRRTR